MLKEAELTEKIIDAAIEVHKTLGPGLLESTYRKCLEYEFSSGIELSYGT
jgi:GxxExxY protein